MDERRPHGARKFRTARATAVVALALACAGAWLPCAADDALRLPRPSSLGPAPTGAAWRLATAPDRVAPSLAFRPTAGVATLPVAARAPGTFWDRHLVPRLSRRFAGRTATDPLTVLGLDARAGNARRDLAMRSAREAGSAATRAVQDWAMDAWALEVRADRWLRSWLAGRPDDPTPDAADDAGGHRPRVSLGVSGALPATDLTWAVGERSTIRLKLRARGAAGMEWRRAGGASHRLYAGWDGDRRRYRLEYRGSF